MTITRFTPAETTNSRALLLPFPERQAKSHRPYMLPGPGLPSECYGPILNQATLCYNPKTACDGHRASSSKHAFRHMQHGETVAPAWNSTPGALVACKQGSALLRQVTKTDSAWRRQTQSKPAMHPATRLTGAAGERNNRKESVNATCNATPSASWQQTLSRGITRIQPAMQPARRPDATNISAMQPSMQLPATGIHRCGHRYQNQEPLIVNCLGKYEQVIKLSSKRHRWIHISYS